jgi:hypothetical protein
MPVQLIKRFWVALVVVAILAGWGVYWFQTAFYDTGYAPEQPIAFYHKVHAGELGIDCKYCHFNADRGKHAGVPPMSVCMGCHRPNNVIASNPEYTKEIANLVAISETGSYTIDGVKYHGAPDGIEYEGGVVHWKRVHKLPDHVYFSHQWHVLAGVACQTCHGPVQEMTVLRQYSNLTMSWCLDCHRKSNYVGGRHYVAGDPTTFTVGTADRDLQVKRQVQDPVVTFLVHGDKSPVPAADTTPAADATPALPPAGEAGRQQLVDAVIDAHAQDAQGQGAQLTPQLAEAMRAQVQKLPIWRLQDLPESHRKYYQDPASFQNALTQCSTCHQ